MSQQPKKSEFDIKLIKLMYLNFKQNEKEINKREIRVNMTMKAFYSRLAHNNIQLNLNIKIALVQNNNLDIGTIDSTIIGVFGYKDKINEELMPNLVSILYSYLRPIVAQLSIMSKLPPIDLPIINLSNIKVIEETINK